MSVPPNPLDYAPRPRRRITRRTLRRLLFIGLAAFLLLVMAALSPRAYQRIRILRAQTLCLNYVAPSSQIVYDDDPRRVPGLLATPGYRTFIYSNGDIGYSAAVL